MSWQVKQRVDFYLEEFHPPQMPNDLKQIMYGVSTHLVIGFIALVGLLVYEDFQSSYLQKMQDRDALASERVNKIESTQPIAKVSNTLTSKRDEARRELDGRRRIFQYLTQQNIEKSLSFTDIVGGFQQHSISGLWLSGFSITNKGQHLILRGYANDPAKVSQYADELLANDAFTRFAFRQVIIEKDVESGWLSFYLSTEPETPEDPLEPQSPILQRQQLIGQVTWE